MTVFGCRACGGTFEADAKPVTKAADWTADDFSAHAEAQSAHMLLDLPGHRTEGGPSQRPARDWVGCRCKGTCHCPRRRSRRAR